MGARIASAMRNDPGYRMLYVEAGAAGQERLREKDLMPISQADAVEQADVIVLAIPDVLIGPVAKTLVPTLKPGTLVICLDPAAPHSGDLPPRRDISYFVVHPCHPPVINDETDPAARLDFFGGKAKQHIVCALMQGPESEYARGEAIARRMFAPVMRAHRVTVEQMAMLEPALSETCVLTFMFAIKEAIDEAVTRGVPEQAAVDFVMGHINVNLGILFKLIDAHFSDGAKLAVKQATPLLLQPDWKKVFEPDNVLQQVKAITQARADLHK
jgi:hypothetical protein